MTHSSSLATLRTALISRVQDVSFDAIPTDEKTMVVRNFMLMTTDSVNDPTALDKGAKAIVVVTREWRAHHGQSIKFGLSCEDASQMAENAIHVVIHCWTQ